MTVTREQVLAQLYPDEPDYEGAAQLGPEALPHLMQLIEEGDPDLASKATSLASVIDAAESIEAVDKAARSPDPVIRVAAAAALGNLSEPPGPVAHSMLDDEDVGVRKLALTAAPVSMDPYVLVSGHETVFEGPEIEGTGRRRCRNAQGGGRKDFLGVDAHHKALAQEASGNGGRPAKSDPWQACQERGDAQRVAARAPGG